MAGRKQYRALEQRLAAQEDEVLSMIGDGALMRVVADAFGTSRTQLYEWLNSTEERKERFQLARRQSATSHADDALAILDAAKTPADIQVAKERAIHRRWLAERLNRQSFGTQPEAPAMSIGELHLHLLRTMQPYAAVSETPSGLLLPGERNT